MQITDFIMALPGCAGRSFGELFGGGSSALVRIDQGDGGAIVITRWDASLGPQPTPEEIEAALEADEPKAVLMAHAAQVRWEREVGGRDWNGHRIQTDRESQSKLIAEFVAITAGLRADGAPWKFAGNDFQTVSNADMGAVIQTARAHVASMFAIEAEVLAAIESGDITTREEIDAAFA